MTNDLMFLNSDNEEITAVSQWDVYRTVKICGVDISENFSYRVHLCGRRKRTAYALDPEVETVELSVDDSDDTEDLSALVITVPTPLLESNDAILVYVVQIDDETDESAVIGASRIFVCGRARPSTYQSVYTRDAKNIADGLVVQNGKMYLSQDGVAFGEGV